MGRGVAEKPMSSCALTELRAHAETVGLRPIRVVYVGPNDLRDSYECRDLECNSR
jgi:hypothetical protein